MTAPGWERRSRVREVNVEDRKRLEERHEEDRDVTAPASPPKAGRTSEGAGSAVTGPRGVGAPDVTDEDVPSHERRDRQGRKG